MAKYLVTDSAKSDVRRIIEYLRARSPQGAKQVRQDLSAAFQRLAEFPHIGHMRDDVPQPGVRFWAVYSYLVVYRSERRPLEIIRVLHGAQDIPSFFNT
jgi:toxin ParE1/3/4